MPYFPPSSATVPQSEIYLQVGNGLGSTSGNKIRRFSSTVISVGSNITYADSATDGASFTINAAGRYAMTYSNISNSAACEFGFSLNSNQLTTSIASITASNIVATVTTSSANINGSVSAILTLAVNDVIRPHGDGGDSNTATAGQVQFRICRIG